LQIQYDKEDRVVFVDALILVLLWKALGAIASKIVALDKSIRGLPERRELTMCLLNLRRKLLLHTLPYR
jgi:hypothetical protein